MLLIIASIASWHPLLDLNPYELATMYASHSGSSAFLTIPFTARSCILGIPNGLFSSPPGFGIHTLRVGFALTFLVTLSWLTSS